MISLNIHTKLPAPIEPQKATKTFIDYKFDSDIQNPALKKDALTQKFLAVWQQARQQERLPFLNLQKKYSTATLSFFSIVQCICLLYGAIRYVDDRNLNKNYRVDKIVLGTGLISSLLLFIVGYLNIGRAPTIKDLKKKQIRTALDKTVTDTEEKATLESILHILQTLNRGYDHGEINRYLPEESVLKNILINMINKK